MADLFLNPQVWAITGLVFALRFIEMALDTLRMLLSLRGRHLVAWVLGFAQSTIFVIAITSVLANVDNPLTIFGYAAGFASGVVAGMWLEERLAIGFADLRIISPRWGSAIAEALRIQGYAVTEIPARGRDGAVSLLNLSVLRRHVDRVVDAATSIDEGAFIIAEDLRPVRRGFWRA